MPTQVPTGSDLAVRRQGGSSSRRRRPSGPKRLIYAKGGPVPSRPKYQRGGQVPDRWGQQERFAPVHPREPESATPPAAAASAPRRLRDAVNPSLPAAKEGPKPPAKGPGRHVRG